ncbi:TetR/AcrR family transcriptional regulator [Paractinoplanes lichenicola]|uniref:TetR/AcrR family transcriptional regulator n=1 Tax=Paractinoplanes lichenicola TaxID=2802976 RepID=A0ABS1VPI1_9ACTN|nr:TetR/AcrR family transcriptional regulator [Actinoplanes lichenicola]MBL7256535.1 TetR/AcrR family transcriptional regulator [Actinoplanes lichenicola]
MVTGIRRQQAAQTEAELKAAAVRVFERAGYLNAKITDITAEAGRATGSFYKHFAGKEQLLEALLQDLLAEGDESAASAEHSDDFRDREAVRYHVAAYWNFYRRHRAVMDALRQAAIVDEGFAERSRQMMEPDLGHIAQHIAKVDPHGDPYVLASIFTTLVSAFAANHPPHDDEAIETLTTFIHNGIGAGRQETATGPDEQT